VIAFFLSHFPLSLRLISSPPTPLHKSARYITDYFQLREAGATQVVPDETEASLRILNGLLGDLGMDSSGIASILESTRADLEVKQDGAFAEFEAQKAGVLTLPSGTNRVSIADQKFPNIANLVPILNDAKRQIDGLIGARTEMKKDSTLPAETDKSLEGQPPLTQDRFGLSVLQSTDAVPGGMYPIDYIPGSARAPLQH